MKEQIINNSIMTETFSKSYPVINKYIVENGDHVESRNGDTKEILNFKTEIHNPYRRCVGNNGRDINVFFLLAEALWIFRGRKDVDFLVKFNNQMKEYSDDGVNFHAPYGFRMRRYGVSSFDNSKPTSPENNGHAHQQMIDGIDQILSAMIMLKENPESRRVVISIWNPDLDLGTVSKDLPCNDMLMLKVRGGKLHSTIANRSNDLHWGLPTNVFQFSFVTEIMSNIMGIELGTQTHNSQSLHFYIDNPIAMKMYENMSFTNSKFDDLYDYSKEIRIDMNFDKVDKRNRQDLSSDSIERKLAIVDDFIDRIIYSLDRGEKMPASDLKALKNFSEYLFITYELLWNYLRYKFGTTKTDQDKKNAIEKLNVLSNEYGNPDIITMCKNFYVSKMKDKSDYQNTILGTL